MDNPDFKKQFDDEPIWWRKVLITSLCHKHMLAKDRYWKMKDTGKLLGRVTSIISENLRIAEAIDNDPKFIGKCESRQKALNKLM